MPEAHLGAVLKLCEERRGVQVELTFAGARALVIYRLPLNEVVFDFYDRLKSASRGYASFDYQMDGAEPAELVKLAILINGEPSMPWASVVHFDRAQARGRALCEPAQGADPAPALRRRHSGRDRRRIVARETVKALRKDVTAKCYGGDVTRKRKLLEKQRAGKKRMRQVGAVNVPQEAFIAALRLDDR